MKLSLKWSKFDKTYPSILLYTVAVISIYVFVVAPLFSYSGLTLEINTSKLLISVLMYIITLWLLPHNIDKPSHHLFFLIYLICYIPTLSYFWLNDKETLYIIYLTFTIIFIELLIGKHSKKVTLRINNGNLFFWGVFILYLISVLVLVINNGGINMNAIHLDIISANRSENDVSGLLGYLLNWCAKSFCPLFFAYFYYVKRKVLMSVTVILQLLLYLSFGFKAFLFSIALLIIITIVMKSKRNYYSALPMILFVGIFFAYLLFELDITSIPLFALPYRTLYVPAAGQFEYYDFFNNNNFLYFSEGIIGKIFNIEYPYSLPIGVIVNQSIHGLGYYSNGNTGMFSYGFADCGFFGMILAGFLLVLVFWIIDNSTHNIPLFIVVAAMSFQMIVLNDTNILISLNTGGIIWTVFLLIVFNSFIAKHMEKAN